MNPRGFQVFAFLLVLLTFCTTNTRPGQSDQKRIPHGTCNKTNIPAVNTFDLLERYPRISYRLKQMWTNNEVGKIFYNKEDCLPEGCYRIYYLHPWNKYNPYGIVRECDKSDVYFTTDHYKTYILLKQVHLVMFGANEHFDEKRIPKGTCNKANIPVVNVSDLLPIYPSARYRLNQICTRNEIGGVYHNKENCLPKNCYRQHYLYPKSHHNPYRFVQTCNGRKVYFTENHYKTFVLLK